MERQGDKGTRGQGEGKKILLVSPSPCLLVPAAPAAPAVAKLQGTNMKITAAVFLISFHGYQHTHLDALCHMFWNGKMYNGFPQEEVTQKGAAKLAIQNLKQGVFTRGVLMDVPRLKGAKYLEPGTPIYPEDLEAWEKKAGLKLTAGDAVFIRTGRWARRAEKGPWNISVNSAGLHASCARWLKARDVALLGSDAASDVIPSGVEGLTLP